MLVQTTSTSAEAGDKRMQIQMVAHYTYIKNSRLKKKGLRLIIESILFVEKLMHFVLTM